MIFQCWRKGRLRLFRWRCLRVHIWGLPLALRSGWRTTWYVPVEGRVGVRGSRTPTANEWRRFVISFEEVAGGIIICLLFDIFNFCALLLKECFESFLFGFEMRLCERRGWSGLWGTNLLRLQYERTIVVQSDGWIEFYKGIGIFSYCIPKESTHTIGPITTRAPFTAFSMPPIPWCPTTPTFGSMPAYQRLTYAPHIAIAYTVVNSVDLRSRRRISARRDWRFWMSSARDERICS
jgi:hypothetical protein